MHMFMYIWDVCESTDFIRCCVYIVIPALNYINHPLISFKRCWSLSQLSLGERCGIPWHSTNSEAVMVLGYFFWQCFKAVDLLSMCYSWAFVLIVLHDFHGFSLFIFFYFSYPASFLLIINYLSSYLFISCFILVILCLLCIFLSLLLLRRYPDLV